MSEGRLSLSFTPDFRNVDLARAALRGVCMDFITEEYDGPGCPSFCLAVTEALNNAVEHSGATAVELEILLENDELACLVITSGPCFDSTLAASLPEGSGTVDAPEGGYGLMLMQQFSDRIEFEHRDGRNILTLFKRRSGLKKEGCHADQN